VKGLQKLEKEQLQLGIDFNGLSTSYGLMSYDDRAAQHRQ
jgi:hypothetical protein